MLSKYNFFSLQPQVTSVICFTHPKATAVHGNAGKDGRLLPVNESHRVIPMKQIDQSTCCTDLI